MPVIARVCVRCSATFGGGSTSTHCDECICGEPAGYQRHWVRGEKACAACKAAVNQKRKSSTPYRQQRNLAASRTCTNCDARIGSRKSSICVDCADERRRTRQSRPNPSPPPVRACPWCGRNRPTERGWEGRFSTCSQTCAQAVLAWEEAHCTPLASSVYRKSCGPQLDEVREVRAAPPCGTPAAYYRHRSQGEGACDGCKAAVSLYVRTRPGYRTRLDGDQIDPLYVAERDGWKCGICGGAIPQDRRHPHPESLQIDHIVPVSVGGEHLLTNVQATHARCNWSKGARAVGSQLRLVG